MMWARNAARAQRGGSSVASAGQTRGLARGPSECWFARVSGVWAQHTQGLRAWPRCLYVASPRGLASAQHGSRSVVRLLGHRNARASSRQTRELHRRLRPGFRSCAVSHAHPRHALPPGGRCLKSVKRRDVDPTTSRDKNQRTPGLRLPRRETLSGLFFPSLRPAAWRQSCPLEVPLSARGRPAVSPRLLGCSAVYQAVFTSHQTLTPPDGEHGISRLTAGRRSLSTAPPPWRTVRLPFTAWSLLGLCRLLSGAKQFSER